MKTSIMIFFLAVVSTSVLGYVSGIAIQTEKGVNMHVYVNGKLYNKQATRFVRLKSMPGIFHIEVRVLNPTNKEWYLVKKDVKIEKGFEFYYKIVFPDGKKPEIRAFKKYPFYTRYFLDPTMYNRRLIS